MKNAIEIKNVSKQYQNKKAVDNLSLTINEGSIVALLGPNGAGKSTTINMILGLTEPTSGQIKLLGKSPKEKSVRNKIGAMLQEVSVIDGLKVRETIDLFRSYYSNALSTNELLKISNLEAEQDKFSSDLSGGQKRRLGFALALAGNPDVLFLDEPTVGMDITSRQIFWETIRSFAGSGKTIILTTHYLEEADNLADRVVVINQGKIIADGTLDEIKASTGMQHVSFTVGENVTSDQLLRLPGVTDVQQSGRRVKVYGADTDQILFSVIRNNIEVRDIETHKSGLEDAFQSLIESSDSKGEENYASIYRTV
ncbi:ABC transporter ATP-binding protein [Bacillus sp. RG28]|uniref:ABC transporter ATP-binding protein n=1 Tax=Gottfriedia endophytica TaxID=2820819 RepID=A0A940SHQ7_9BACI|nr:ABC transporter ATP-binding protein [Gottfriedia endophytica]MBP0726437.1 ABC transporter ATP-binding protein [Gottfriedia endophytica]